MLPLIVLRTPHHESWAINNYPYDRWQGQYDYLQATNRGLGLKGRRNISAGTGVIQKVFNHTNMVSLMIPNVIRIIPLRCIHPKKRLSTERFECFLFLSFRWHCSFLKGEQTHNTHLGWGWSYQPPSGWKIRPIWISRILQFGSKRVTARS